MRAEKRTPRSPTGASLRRARDQSALVQDKVEQAAVELSKVNAVLQEELTRDGTSPTIDIALHQGTAIEKNVEEAAHDLVVVSAALEEEVHARQGLEQQLADSDEALAASRADESRARHSALHDAATGLANNTLFNDRLDNAVVHAHRHGRHIAVMFVDIDHFKRVNDTHGHAIGDAVLQMVAERLTASMRASDTVSRRGGDDFVILLLEPHDTSNVTALAARIRERIAEDCTFGDLTLSVTVSIGMAIFPEDAHDSLALLRHADAAMYAMKGRNVATA